MIAKICKAITCLVFTLLVILLLAVGLLYFGTTPTYSNTFHLEKSYGTAKVHREENGIPHIFASNKLMAIYT